MALGAYERESVRGRESDRVNVSVGLSASAIVRMGL